MCNEIKSALGNRFKTVSRYNLITNIYYGINSLIWAHRHTFRLNIALHSVRQRSMFSYKYIYFMIKKQSVFLDIRFFYLLFSRCIDVVVVVVINITRNTAFRSRSQGKIEEREKTTMKNSVFYLVYFNGSTSFYTHDRVGSLFDYFISWGLSRYVGSF